MANTNRTNPAYAYLAYRRAIINHVTHLLVTDYMAPTDGEPNEHIFTDEVFRTDSQVPLSEIQSYLEDLQIEDAKLQLEMNKFEFRVAEPPKQIEAVQTKEPENESEPKQKEPKGGGNGSAAPAKLQRRHRKDQPN